ncbi:hypothetical protein [Prevotella sp.]|uniref:hypothetical protein n=1 Tax=Prevotella sp. TaxID=59823 RepID=UPI001CAF758F|nr:hypothetical protein [Prevotella sp.]MBF1629248.1 hypothetical protein [Prevotella sp.]
MRKLTFKTSILSLAALCGLTLTLGSCANEDIAQNGNGTDNDKNLTIFSTGEEPATRTSMESNGTFYWEAGDKIWVKDDNGAWQQSSNSPLGKTASFKFKVPGKFTKGNTYKVYYPGRNGNQNRVTIAANQTQTEPNSTAHFGTSGDCGTADAAWSNSKNGFAFTLDHQAAYLIFQPYTSNTVLHNCYLTKIEVTSDDDISSNTYTLNPSTGTLTGTGNGKQIVLTTKGNYGSTYQNGFPLTNTSASLTTNGAYMVIKPGTHTLRIRYWVKDVATTVEGTITKVLSSHNFAKNEYVNMEAALDVKNYDGDHYYMWDAQDQYWKGHEWNHGGSQPTLYYYSPGGTTSSDYAKSSSDSRYCNTSYPGPGISNPAIHSCKDLPNVNEMTWYAAKGDPRWDADELWTTMGHLYKGGMWFKKKSQISGYNPNTAYDGTDWRTVFKRQNWTPSSTLPSAADAGNYFYLPALGYYDTGGLAHVGSAGYYWSSSAEPWHSNAAYNLHFGGGNVAVDNYLYRYAGYRVGGFE